MNINYSRISCKAKRWKFVATSSKAQNDLHVFQDMFKRLVDAVPEVKFELYSFKSTIKCKEMLEQDCWFENKVSI